MAVAQNHNPATTGGELSRFETYTHLQVARKGNIEPSELGSLDAPQYIPLGSSFAFDSLGDIFTCGTIASRDA